VDVLFLYDDTRPTPELIRQIIGVDRFSQVVRRKQRLARVIADAVDGIAGVRFVAVTDPADLVTQIDMLERGDRRQRVLRLPSSLAPVQMDVFVRILRKLPHAPDAAQLGESHGDEAVTLLDAQDAVELMRLPVGERRALLGRFSDTALHVDTVSFLDLRDIDQFLAYMMGATEVRHFNAMEASGSIYRKSSRDIAKMRAEHDFFHLVPPEMKRFLLPTFGFREDGESASYAMERMSVPDAALQIVHNSFTPASFDRLLDLFFEFVAARERRPIPREAVLQEANEGILVKTDRRVDALMESATGVQLDRLLASATDLGGVRDLQARATRLIARQLEADRTDHLAVSHGDPCLSNILFHRDLGLFRLIDPRGSTTLEGSLMHPVYDVAKFSHSILGGYDFINNGLFECRLDSENRLALHLDDRGPPAWMQAAFRTRIAAEGFNPALVRAIELSLFVSMLPLHADVPRKLPAFCLTAAAIIQELESLA
jgi:hypothetical protein